MLSQQQDKMFFMWTTQAVIGRFCLSVVMFFMKVILVCHNDRLGLVSLVTGESRY
jgi:hypothetical protein